MNNNIEISENEVIKKAVLMLKDNLFDMKNYLSHSISPTLKLQKIKVEILKVDDRLNEIYNVLSTQDELKLSRIKQLCNILQEEAKAKIEEQELYNNFSDKEYQEYMIENDNYYEAMEEAYVEEQKKAKDFEKIIQKERLENKILYGLDYANYHCYNRYSEITGPATTIKDFEERAQNAQSGVGFNSKEFYEDIIKRKNYEKFYIKAKNPMLEEYKVSKRKLPTKIFTYLFSNGYLSDKDLATYSTNQFGRTFETKRGDILTESEMNDNQKNLHRYNKVDFSKIIGSKYNKILYISNQWDYDSITKFNEHINETFKGIIFADEERNIEILKNWK